MRNNTVWKRTLSVVLTAAACLLVAVAAPAAEDFTSPEEYSRWAMGYYRNPEPARIPRALVWFARNIPADRFGDFSGMAFFGAVLAREPEIANQAFTTADASNSDRMRQCTALALWQAQTPACDELLAQAATRWQGEAMAKMLAHMQAHRPKNLFTDPITDAAELDALWCIFMATGEAPAVARIREEAKRKATAKTPMEMAIAGAAAWSLDSNMKNLPGVREIVEVLDRNEAAAKAKGSDINYGDAGTWKRQAGNLGGSLLLVPDWDAFLGEWQKDTPGVELTTTQTVRKGRKIAAVVMFAGCAPDAKGQCRSTVRFTICRPDGKQDAHPADELWTGKPAPAPGAIELSMTNMILSFADSDPAGTYRIQATLHDELAGRDLVLETPLTVE